MLVKYNSPTQLNFMAFAVPLFLLLLFIEYLVTQKQRKEAFHFEEAVANINVGIGERLTDVFTTGMFYFLFQWLYIHCRLFTIPSNWFSYLLLFLVTDLVWYWYHRFGHKVNLFWAIHGVHHQSEDFNFTVSVRITVLQSALRSLFWAILPVLGFNPKAVAIMLIIHAGYSFFTHTRAIGKLGWLEYILVTPSHHRVHHSSNPEYLDKNFGDVLIIWDKIFGTFTKETVPANYGLTKPLNSYSFLWQHTHLLFEMAIAFSRAKSIRQKSIILFGTPDNIDPVIREILERKTLRRNTQTNPGPHLYRYIAIQTGLTLTVLFFTLLFVHYMDAPELTVAAMFILISVISTGAMLEQRRWVFPLEICRLLLCCIYVHFVYPAAVLTGACCTGFIILLIYYKTVRSYYINRLYTPAPTFNL